MRIKINMWARLSPRDQRTLKVGGVVAGFLLLLYLGLYFFDPLVAENPQVEEKELLLQRYLRLAGSTEVKTQLAEREERRTALRAGLLESRSVSLAGAEWQRLVRDLAESKGIELVRSEFLRVQETNSEYSLVSGRVQFRCRPDQLVDFLIALANSPKLLSVPQLKAYSLANDPEKRLVIDMTIGAAAMISLQTEEGSGEKR